tara:strand:+ start:122 stop:619 length:498 start_codon:yes stop_codon:yes gene_type:complete
MVSKKEQENKIEYADIVDRFSAIMIDTIILVGITIILSLLIGRLNLFETNIEFIDPISFLRRSLISPIVWMTTIIYILYYTYFEGKYGQTVGKKLSRIKVIDEYTRKQIGYKNAFLRTVARLVDSLPILYILGIIIIKYTKNNQRIGDLLSKSIVIKTKIVSKEI